MSNGQRTLNDLNTLQYMNTPVSTPMPPPVVPYMPTPHEVTQQFFGPMNISAHARFGYQQIGQFNQMSPVGLGSQYSPNANMMTPAALSIFRPPPTPMPAPLRTTPGVTAAFHNPMDIATQQTLGIASAYLDPNAGAKLLARQQGQAAGGYVGAGIGAIAGAAISGGAGAVNGAMWGQTLGDLFGGAIAKIPIVGDLMEWGNREEAQMLSNMAGVQIGTMGRVSMGRQDIGLGGRGISSLSSMRLGRNLQAFSNQMAGVKTTAVNGGMFNEADIRNLVAASADSGLLDAASNIDQIEGTVKKVMTLVGRLGKLTGDPDFRNNIRELGRMKMLGFGMDQAVEALSSMSRYGIASGMSRGQLMTQAIQPAMARFAAAGLVPGLGMTHGAFGAAEGRMQAGIGTPIQQALMGDVGQRVTEANAAFLSGQAQMLLPALYKAEGGKLTLDPSKIQEIASAGVINMRTMAAQGAQNMRQVAENYARQKIARGEGGPQDYQALFREGYEMMSSRQSEFLSELGMRLTPEQTMRANLAMAAGLQKQGMSQWESLMAVTSNAQGQPDPMQAKMLLDYARDPKRHARALAQLDLQIQKAEGDAMKLGRAKATAWANENRAGALYKGLRGAGRWVSDLFTDEIDVDDILDSEKKARDAAMQNELLTSGTKTFRSSLVGSRDLSKRVVEAQKRMYSALPVGMGFDASMTTIDETGHVSLMAGHPGVQSYASSELSESEIIRMQRLSGEYGTVWGAAKRGSLLVDWATGGYKRADYNRAMAQSRNSAKVMDKAMRRKEADQQSLEKQMRGKLGEWGVKDPAAVMARIKSTVINLAHSRGKLGAAVQVEDLKDAVEHVLTTGVKTKYGQLIQKGAVHDFMRKNPSLMSEMLGRIVMDEGDTTAKGALLESISVGMETGKYGTVEDLDQLEDLQTKMSDKLMDWLAAGNLAEVDTEWWGPNKFENVGEREAFQAIHAALAKEGETGAGAADEAYLTAQMAAEYSGTEEERDKARVEVEEMRAEYERKGDKAGLARVERIRKKVSAMGEEQRKALAKWGGFFSGAKGGREAARKELTKAATTGTGKYGMIMSADILAAIQAKTPGGGKMVMEAEAFTPMHPKKVEEFKKEKTAEENLYKVWTAPGGIADKFDSGMGKLEKAAQKLSSLADKIKLKEV